MFHFLDKAIVEKHIKSFLEPEEELFYVILQSPTRQKKAPTGIMKLTIVFLSILGVFWLLFGMALCSSLMFDFHFTSMFFLVISLVYFFVFIFWFTRKEREDFIIGALTTKSVVMLEYPKRLRTMDELEEMARESISIHRMGYEDIKTLAIHSRKLDKAKLNISIPENPDKYFEFEIDDVEAAARAISDLSSIKKLKG